MGWLEPEPQRPVEATSFYLLLVTAILLMCYRLFLNNNMLFCVMTADDKDKLLTAFRSSNLSWYMDFNTNALLLTPERFALDAWQQGFRYKYCSRGGLVLSVDMVASNLLLDLHERRYLPYRMMRGVRSRDEVSLTVQSSSTSETTTTASPGSSVTL